MGIFIVKKMAIDINTILQDWQGLFYSYLPKIIGVIVTVVVGGIIVKILVKLIEKFFDKVDFERSVETFIENIVKVLLWAILVIIILANLGVDVSGLIAGLGIMGFIVGFALKDTLGNLASGVFLLFHKPFKVGDYVEAGGKKGTVKALGIAATELNTPDNKKIVLPNSKVWGGPITNYTSQKQRRDEIIVGISYDSDINKALKLVMGLMKKDKRVLKDPEPFVGVKELADSSVNLIVRPWVKVSDYWPTHWDMVKNIKEEFDRNKISIPFPQRDVHLHNVKKRK